MRLAQAGRRWGCQKWAGGTFQPVQAVQSCLCSAGRRAVTSCDTRDVAFAALRARFFHEAAAESSWCLWDVMRGWADSAPAPWPLSLALGKCLGASGAQRFAVSEPQREETELGEFQNSTFQAARKAFSALRRVPAFHVLCCSMPQRHSSLSRAFLFALKAFQRAPCTKICLF